MSFSAFSRTTLLSIFLAAATLPLSVFAQNTTITGSVTDGAGKPLEKVSVLVKGTSTGTTTDANGPCQLHVTRPSGNTLVFSSLGFAGKEILQSQENTINVNWAIQANSNGVINQNKGYFGYEGNVQPLTEIP